MVTWKLSKNPNSLCSGVSWVEDHVTLTEFQCPCLGAPTLFHVHREQFSGLRDLISKQVKMHKQIILESVIRGLYHLAWTEVICEA